MATTVRPRDILRGYAPHESASFRRRGHPPAARDRAGVPQPRYAAIRRLNEADAALAEVGLPAVLKPADSGGQRGVFRIDSRADLERHLHAALAESASQECILEGFVD